ncbi:hypothetical protein ABPG75_006016 [Micractinium tetrahymenae]
MSPPAMVVGLITSYVLLPPGSWVAAQQRAKASGPLWVSTAADSLLLLLVAACFYGIHLLVALLFVALVPVSATLKVVDRRSGEAARAWQWWAVGCSTAVSAAALVWYALALLRRDARYQAALCASKREQDEATGIA